MKLYLDLETFSTTPLTRGLYAYAEKAEVLLTAWAVDNGPVRVDEGVSPEFRAALAAADEVWAHNAEFDRTILLAVGVTEAEDVRRWRCTRARALAHSLPGSLDALCKWFGLPAEDAKQAAEGKRLIKLFCVPQKYGRRVLPADAPAEWAKFCEYARFDVRALRAVEELLPTANYSGAELALWHVDQEINRRGVQIDVELATAAEVAAGRLRRLYDVRASSLSAGRLASVRQRDALLRELAEQYGVVLPDLRAGTIEGALRGDLPPEARQLLLARAEGALAASRKYETALAAVSKDGRLRGLLQFCGASRTGRWSGRLVQPQNMPRPPAYLKGDAFDAAVAVVRAGEVDTVYPAPMEVLSGVVRGLFVAPPGRKLVVADYSAIEARVLAWLAGEQRVLDTFLRGEDLYVATYAASFGVRPETVTPEQRQLGKVQALALGYGGGVGAVLKMGGERVRAWSDDYIRDQLVSPWRTAHPNIVRLWRALEGAARAAVQSPGTTFRVGRLRIACTPDGTLCIRLPSGRFLVYNRAELDRDGGVTYFGTAPFGGAPARISTYGGMLTENAAQAVARDVLAAGILNATAQGYEIVLTVHDEIVAEVDEAGPLTADGLCRAMTVLPDAPWTEGLPLAAAGFETRRYRKE